MRSKIEDPMQKESWEALSRIHRRPYWRRLWIIQEIVSNLRTYVHIGPKTTHLMPLLTTGQLIFESARYFTVRRYTSLLGLRNWMSSAAPRKASVIAAETRMRMLCCRHGCLTGTASPRVGHE